MCINGYDPCQDDIGCISAQKAKILRRFKKRPNLMTISLGYPRSAKKKGGINISTNIPAPPTIFN